MLTLLGTLLGFLTSVFPKALAFFQDKSDKAHELTLLKEQASIEANRAIQVASIVKEQAVRVAEVNHDVRELEALIDNNKSLNSNLTERDFALGLGWVDKLRASVRPVITYWWMLLYSGVKVALIIYVMSDPTLTLGDSISIVWTVDDMALFASIIAFWFGHRMMNPPRS